MSSVLVDFLLAAGETASFEFSLESGEDDVEDAAPCATADEAKLAGEESGESSWCFRNGDSGGSGGFPWGRSVEEEAFGDGDDEMETPLSQNISRESGRIFLILKAIVSLKLSNTVVVLLERALWVRRSDAPRRVGERYVDGVVIVVVSAITGKSNVDH